MNILPDSIMSGILSQMKALAVMFKVSLPAVFIDFHLPVIGS